jgi:O-acetyl-ADP-ribose deacetylase (regulator of RNase III)
VIHVVVGELASQSQEGLLRAVRADLTPLTAGGRDVLVRAGEAVLRRLEHMGPLPVGGAVISPGGELAASFLIHAVTSAADEPETDLTVRNALQNGLRRAAEFGLESLALEALGLGAGHMDPEDATRSMVEVLMEHLDQADPPLDLTVVVRDPYLAGLFERAIAGLAGDPSPAAF